MRKLNSWRLILFQLRCRLGFHPWGVWERMANHKQWRLCPRCGKYEVQ